MKYSLFAVAAAAVLFPSLASAADTSGPVLEAGYGHYMDVDGIEIGGGWRFGSGAFHLTPGAGILIYQGENEDYYHDSGVDRCRNRRNGQFAKDIMCNATEIDPYARLEVTASYRRLEAGVGYRVSSEGDVVYGTASYGLGNNMYVKASAGQDYYGLGLTLRR